MKKLLFVLAALAATFALPATASAHVRLDPATAAVGRQSFGVRVPNEKDIPTTKVVVVVPDGVDITGVMPIPGWNHSEKKVPIENPEEPSGGHGEAAAERISEITWSGGEIKAGEYMVFNFNTNYTGGPADLKWKAFQTYSDGTVVPWDDSSADNPAPVVKITETSATQQLTDQVAEIQKESDSFKPDLNTWLAGAALLVGAAALFMTIRKS